MCSPSWSILVCKIPQFLAKSYRFGQLIMIFQKVDTLRLLKIYIMFCPPARAKYSFFQAPAHGLKQPSWILQKIANKRTLLRNSIVKRDKVFKNGPSETCGKHPLKIFKGCLPQILLSPFLSTLFQISYPVSRRRYLVKRNILK